MATKRNKYSFELCKRRGQQLHPVLTDSSAREKHDIKVVAEKNDIDKPRKETRQKPGKIDMNSLSDEDIRQHAVSSHPKIYSDDTIDEKLENEIALMRIHQEVQQMPRRRRPRLGIKMTFDDYRGELQTRAFWANIRMQLQIDEEDDNIDESKSRVVNTVEDSIDKDHVKAKMKERTRGLRPLKLVTKVYGRQEARSSKWLGVMGAMGAMGGLHCPRSTKSVSQPRIF